MRAILLLAGVSAALVSFSCRGCGGPPAPVPRADAQLVDSALLGGASYRRAIDELENEPDRGLQAIRQTSAKPGTREAFVLRMLEAHLSDVKHFRRWREQLQNARTDNTILGPRFDPSKLEGLNDPWFWAERALVPGSDAEATTAVEKLTALRNPVATEALFWLAATPPGSHLARARAQQALGRLGRGRELAQALSHWQRAEVPESLRTQQQATLRASLETMPPAARRETEAALLDALVGEPLDLAARRGYLDALAVVGSAASLDRLAELRRTDWGRALRPEIDRTIGAIVARADEAAQRTLAPAPERRP